MIRDAYRMHTRLTWVVLALAIVAVVMSAVALARPTAATAKAAASPPDDQGDRPVHRRRKCNCGK